MGFSPIIRISRDGRDSNQRLSMATRRLEFRWSLWNQGQEIDSDGVESCSPCHYIFNDPNDGQCKTKTDELKENMK